MWKSATGPLMLAASSHFGRPQLNLALSGVAIGAMRRWGPKFAAAHVGKVTDMFAKTKVDRGTLWMPAVERLMEPALTEEAMRADHDLLVRLTVEAGARAIRKVVASEAAQAAAPGLLLSDVTSHLSHSTSFALPNFDVGINRELGFSSARVTRDTLAPAGCSGGIHLLRQSLARVSAGNPLAVMSTVEMPSQIWGRVGVAMRGNLEYLDRNWDAYERSTRAADPLAQQFGPPDPNGASSSGGAAFDSTEFARTTKAFQENLMKLALFRDGAGALCFAHDSHPLIASAAATARSKSGAKHGAVLRPRVIGSATEILDDTAHVVGNRPAPGGLEAYVRAALPDLAAIHVPRVLDQLLKRFGIASHREIEHWVWHAGGPKILRVLQDKLCISPDAFADGYASLRENGNCMSVSVVDGFARLLAPENRGRLRRGDRVVCVGLGPGAEVGIVLARIDEVGRAP